VLNHPNVAGTSYTVQAHEALTPGHFLGWYVGAVSTDNVVNRYDPAGQSFQLAALAAPVQQGPSGVISSTSPVFAWNAVAGADRYYLYVVDFTGQVVVNNPNVTTTSYTHGVALAPGRHYAWYVGAISKNGLINSYVALGLAFEIA
jgi:hypothetical protein